MDPRRAPPRGGGANGLSYSTLFNLEVVLLSRVKRVSLRHVLDTTLRGRCNYWVTELVIARFWVNSLPRDTYFVPCFFGVQSGGHFGVVPPLLSSAVSGCLIFD